MDAASRGTTLTVRRLAGSTGACTTEGMISRGDDVKKATAADRRGSRALVTAACSFCTVVDAGSTGSCITEGMISGGDDVKLVTTAERRGSGALITAASSFRAADDAGRRGLAQDMLDLLCPIAIMYQEKKITAKKTRLTSLTQRTMNLGYPWLEL